MGTKAAARPAWAGLRSSWLPVPGDAAGGDRRYYAVALMTPVGLTMYLVGLPLVAWLRLWPLFAANVFLLLLWVAVMTTARRGQVRLSAALMFWASICNGVGAVVYFGWDFGGQYVLILQLVATVLGPWQRRAAAWLAVLVLVVFLALYYYSRAVPPLYEIPTGLLAIFYGLGVFFMLGLATVLLDHADAVADRAEEELAEEHRRSERLLTNVFPQQVARRLKAGEEPIADRANTASVLFADIVDFTPFAARLSPEEVVTLLDSVFTQLDRLVDAYGLEKIKTIGDAYMVAAGIPHPRPDHAQALARFALAARDEVAIPQPGQDTLQLRIGMASGPVVAGVIGRRRFLYDLWGDTVNIAARMESHGVPGRIQITEGTRRLLGSEFDCQDRGLIDVKGKGKMRAFLLEWPRPA